MVFQYMKVHFGIPKNVMLKSYIGILFDMHCNVALIDLGETSQHTYSGERGDLDWKPESEFGRKDEGWDLYFTPMTD